MHIIANNKKAFFEYFILEKIEAGIQLTGSEVKSLRAGKASIKEAYAEAKKGQLFLINSDISIYDKASSYSRLDSKRVRKLLVHKKQISKLQGKIEKEGMTIVPLKIYFNKKGIAKIEIAIAKGKKLYDKRESKKKRDWNIQKKRLLKNNN
ncbi:MAG: SsrA-binding protein [Pelagibacterales bacterium]|nr:SsrA-binding protein [Pelagibacterales bacterium]OUU61865.1 MAG: SsrA-binding protein [Alphaproteobacteria bacterium TMED62]